MRFRAWASVLIRRRSAVYSACRRIFCPRLSHSTGPSVTGKNVSRAISSKGGAKAIEKAFDRESDVSWKIDSIYSQILLKYRTVALPTARSLSSSVPWLNFLNLLKALRKRCIRAQRKVAVYKLLKYARDLSYGRLHLELWRAARDITLVCVLLECF